MCLHLLSGRSCRPCWQAAFTAPVMRPASRFGRPGRETRQRLGKWGRRWHVGSRPWGVGKQIMLRRGFLSFVLATPPLRRSVGLCQSSKQTAFQHWDDRHKNAKSRRKSLYLLRYFFELFLGAPCAQSCHARPGVAVTSFVTACPDSVPVVLRFRPETLH